MLALNSRYAMFLTLIFVSLLTLFVFIKSRYKFWVSRGFPSAKAKFLIGNIDGVGRSRSTAQALKSLYEQHREEDFVGIYLLTSPALLIISPEMVKSILVRDFSSFSDRGMYYNKRDDPLSANLLTMRFDDWKPMRAKITPTFSTGKIKTMFDIISRITDNLVDKLSSEEEANITETIAMYSTDIISNIAFGLESNCLADPDSEIRKYGKLIFETNWKRLMRFFVSSQFPNFAAALRLTSTNKVASDYFMRLFIDTVKYRETNDVRRNDFMQMLIDLRNSSQGRELKLTELASESFIFFGGGFETTSTTVTYALYEMAQNHAIQSKLRDELTENVADGESFTYETLLELKYLGRVVSETLRKYPAIPMTLRKCTHDYQIANSSLTVPEGVTVMVPILAIHHDPLYYPQPSAFDPERFTDENVRTRPAYTYLPFGEGNRNCVGMRFALLQAKIAIAKLVLNYEFSVCEKTKIPMEFDPTTPFLTPKADIYLMLRPIK